MVREPLKKLGILCRAGLGAPAAIAILSAFLVCPPARAEVCPWWALKTYPVSAPVEIKRVSVAGLFGYFRRFGFNSANMIDKMHKDLGPVVIVDPPRFPFSLFSRHSVVFIRDRDLALKVLGETEAKQRNYERDPRASQGGSNIYGSDNVFFTHGPKWTEHRTALAKSFGQTAMTSPKVFEALHGSLEEPLRDLERRIEEAGGKLEIDLEKELEKMAVKMTVEGLYGKAITLDETEDMTASIATVNRWFVKDTLFNIAKIPLSKLPRWLPGVGPAQDSNEQMRAMAQSIYDLGPDGGVLSTAFTDPTLSPERQRNNIQVILGGATEASTSYFSWVMHDLLWHPTELAAVRAEIDANLKGQALAPSQRSSLPSFQRASLESLRLHTPFFIIPRRTIQDTEIEIDGRKVKIPAGTHVVFSAYSYHRSEADWGVEKTGYPADQYVPERFSVENQTKMGSEHALTLPIGYGFGPRVCLGRFAAEAEKDVLITTLLQRFEMKPLGTGHVVDITSTMATHPKGGLPVEIRMRGRTP